MPNKKNLHIANSYNVWNISEMKCNISMVAYRKYNVWFDDNSLPKLLLNRSWLSLYVEWWLHNIGFYLTRPLCKYPYFKALNNRFKDVDLEEWQ